MKIIYLWRRFSQTTKTSNERFQGSPEVHFGFKIKIYASEKHLVTKKLQIMRFKKWDQSGTWISTILQRFARKMFFKFSRTFLDISKNQGYF